MGNACEDCSHPAKGKEEDELTVAEKKTIEEKVETKTDPKKAKGLNTCKSIPGWYCSIYGRVGRQSGLHPRQKVVRIMWASTGWLPVRRFTDRDGMRRPSHLSW
eukprot:Selendium_serpulae@DN3102_c0_g1_i2.p1